MPRKSNGFNSVLKIAWCKRNHMNAAQVFDKVVWSTCNVNCGSRCPLRLYVKEGKVVRIEPDNTGEEPCGPHEIRACLLRFKYWWDEPAGDNRRCYHTENHQIIFHSDELLAGQLFPDRTFQNDGRDGRYHVEHALHLIRRWLDFRRRFGFSEWLSNCYFDEDLLAPEPDDADGERNRRQQHQTLRDHADGAGHGDWPDPRALRRSALPRQRAARLIGRCGAAPARVYKPAYLHTR